jgi:hypothetical protein
MDIPAPKKPDKYDSPENSTFYESGKYQSLANDEFRLLRLLPGKENSKLCCELLQNIPINSPPPYEAISYCAGNHKKTIPIQIDGVQFNAFESVGKALHQIQLDTSDRILWTDQICINMNNNKEREQQVGVMRNIYESATCVLMWTGRDSLGLNVSVDPFAAMRKYGSAELKQHLGQLGIQSESEHIEVTYNNREILKQSYAKFWDEFQSAFSNPYWSRAWICQEMIVAEELLILGGPKTERGTANLSWQVISKLLEILRIALAFTSKSKIREQCGNLQENECLLLEDCAEMFRKGFTGQATITNLLWVVDMRNSWKTRRPGNLKTLLHHARSCEMTDPRDRVYAFLGLADPGYAIVPDYTSGNEESVFVQVATQIISYEGKLEILQDSEGVAGRHGQCPSWVPNWSSTFARQFDHPFVSFKASADTAATAAFRSSASGMGRVLCAQGMIIDRIAKDEHRLFHTNPEFSYKRDRETIEKFLVFLGEPPDVPENDCTVAKTSLWDNLLAFARKQPKRESTVGLLWYSITLGLGHELESLDSSELESRIEGLLKWGGFNKNATVFRSPKGYVGQVFKSARPTDSLCIFPGASVPFVIRKEEDHYLLSLLLIYTG